MQNSRKIVINKCEQYMWLDNLASDKQDKVWFSNSNFPLQLEILKLSRDNKIFATQLKVVNCSLWQMTLNLQFWKLIIMSVTESTGKIFKFICFPVFPWLDWAASSEFWRSKQSLHKYKKECSRTEQAICWVNRWLILLDCREWRDSFTESQ